MRILSTCAATVLGSLVEPFEDLDGDRTPGGGAEQTEDDLERALLAVAAVSALGEFAARPLDVAGGQVVEHEGVFLEVALGEALLDGRLPLDEPVHRGVQLLVVDGAEVEHLAERGDGAFGRQCAGGGELRLRVDDTGDEHTSAHTSVRYCIVSRCRHVRRRRSYPGHAAPQAGQTSVSPTNSTPTSTSPCSRASRTSHTCHGRSMPSSLS